MPTDYTQLPPTDPNYVSPQLYASLPSKLRNAVSGNYTPGGGIPGLTQLNQTLQRPLTYLPVSHPNLTRNAALGIGLFGAGYAIPAAYGAYGAYGAGAGGSAATVNPFAANAGMGTPWASIGGTAAYPTLGSAAGIPASYGATAAGAAGGTAAAAGTPWYNTFWGQTALNTGGNLLSGFLGNRAIQNAQNQSNRQIEDRLRRALAALSPTQIMALMQQFLPQMAQNANQAGQTAIQAVREQAARTGQLESPRALSFEAGTRAKLASDVQQRAFEAAFNTAGAQASAITGAPYTPIQPQMGIADAITQSIQMARQADFYRQANQQAAQTGVPYRWPGSNPWYPWSTGG